MLYKGTQTSHAPSGIRTHHPSACPGHGSHSRSLNSLGHAFNQSDKIMNSDKNTDAPRFLAG